MTKSSEMFQKIIKEVPDTIEGKIFGAPCIKLLNGKTVAIFWKNNMLFKLDDNTQEETLKLDGSSIGTHLYARERVMKGWILIPFKHSDKWVIFAKKAVKFVKLLN
jgi:hypothetical protein